MRSDGYGTWFVCQSVYDYSRTTGNEDALERYQQLQCNKCSKIKTAILLKRRRSRARNRHVADHVAWPNPSISSVSMCIRTLGLASPRWALASRPDRVDPANHAFATSWRSRCAVQYCYLLMPPVCEKLALLFHYVLADGAKGLHFTAFHSLNY